MLLPNDYYESFCKLSFAVRLLSDKDIHSSDLRHADNLIELFFQNFVHLYGEESQSFNFHTMRHLVEQVKRNGPLFLFSAFCFESANHMLLSALSGTIKNPEKMFIRFLKHQRLFEQQSMQNGTTEKNSITTSLTKLTDCSKKFVSENSIEAAGGRFVNENGKKTLFPFLYAC